MEDIRFASYRAAAKLRCLQRQTYLYHIDIWNMIEAFRERGLHGLDANAKLTENKVRALLASLYGDLQKRLPPSTTGGSSQQTLSAGAGVVASSSAFLQAKENLLFSFLWRALRSSSHSDRLRVRTLKAALAALCTGKLMDKLRYLFSQVSDDEGHLVRPKFGLFLRDIMRIPAALGEYGAFSGSAGEEAPAIFGGEESGPVNVNDFLEAMMSDPGPQCLSWLLVLHRLINSESTFHPVACGSCLAQGFHGLRYKSDRGNYHLCQNCFWRGRIAPEHAEDVFKEYNSFKSSSGKSSLKKSLQCIPSERQHGRGAGGGGGGSSGSKSLPHFPDEPERQMDLSNLVPAPPGVIVINGEVQQRDFDPGDFEHMQSHVDMDEHHLIAQYANQIASSSDQDRQHHHRGRHGQRHHRHHRPPSTSPGRRSLSNSRQLVADLERKNREIMRDINELRQQQRGHLEGGGGGGGEGGSPKLLSELSHLRNKKNVLDERLNELQGTREELMIELEELMKLLRSQKVTPPPPPDLTVTEPDGRYAYDAEGRSAFGYDPLYPPDPSLSDE